MKLFDKISNFDFQDFPELLNLATLNVKWGPRVADFSNLDCKLGPPIHGQLTKRNMNEVDLIETPEGKVHEKRSSMSQNDQLELHIIPQTSVHDMHWQLPPS